MVVIAVHAVNMRKGGGGDRISRRRDRFPAIICNDLDINSFNLLWVSQFPDELHHNEQN
jgi:hypothetical protein